MEFSDLIESLIIEDMKRFQCKLGSILNIRQEKLQLQSVQKGCVLFTPQVTFPDANKQWIN